METCRLGLVFSLVALLLKPTSGDVLVQPGYGQPAAQTSKNSVDQSSSNSFKNQPTVNPQQNYNLQSQNPALQSLQQEHKLQQQALQQQHQLEHGQLLQLQHQQLQNPAQNQYVGMKGPGGELVGTPFGGSSFLAPGGALNHGKLFSLGPFGLHSLGFGSGLGGLPLLMSPYHSPYMTGSTQYGSFDGTNQLRTRRDTGDARESTSGKKFREKGSRTEHDDVATSPTLTPKPDDTTPSSSQPSKRHGSGAVSSIGKDETVGSGLLDPLGLFDKTEGFINDLKSGHISGPMDMFQHGGHSSGFPNFLSQGYSGDPHIEEHVVSQTHQNPGRYDSTDQHFYPAHQSQQPIVGNSRFVVPPTSYRPLPLPGSVYGPGYRYGMYPTGYSIYRPRFRNSVPMGPHGSIMGYPRSSGQGYKTINPIIGASNSAMNSESYQQSGLQNPSTGNSQTMLEGKDGSGNSMEEDSFTGNPNPSGYYNNDPRNNMNPMTGRSGPSLWDGGPIPLNNENGGAADPKEASNGLIGDPITGNLFDLNDESNYYDSQRHGGYDFDDMFDQTDYGYQNYGGYDRIYETTGYNNYPYNYGGGGGHPHHTHHHQSYFL